MLFYCAVFLPGPSAPWNSLDSPILLLSSLPSPLPSSYPPLSHFPSFPLSSQLPPSLPGIRMLSEKVGGLSELMARLAGPPGWCFRPICGPLVWSVHSDEKRNFIVWYHPQLTAHICWVLLLSWLLSVGYTLEGSLFPHSGIRGGSNKSWEKETLYSTNIASWRWRMWEDRHTLGQSSL